MRALNFFRKSTDRKATAKAGARRNGRVGAFLRLMRAYPRTGFAAAIALLAVCVGLGSIAAAQFGYIDLLKQESSRYVRQTLLDLGLSVRSVTVAGRAQTETTEILDALNVAVGDSILHADITAAQQRLAKLAWVKRATIIRKLPDTLHVEIEERRPIAIWQIDRRMVLVDYRGAPITEKDVPEYVHLPLVVGKGAAEAASDLLTMLSRERWLQRRVAAAIRIGGRRWDLRLQNGIDIRLPEADPQTAWRVLAAYEAREGLLGRDVEVVDLRLPDQVIVRLSEGRVRRIGPQGREARLSRNPMRRWS
jgi:cell division protein FtsQ